MPIYTYHCTNKDCNNTFDIVQSIKDEPLILCEICGGKLEKLIGNTSFILNGKGWFRDGYSK